MSKISVEQPFHSVLSFRPFINHLKKMAEADKSLFWLHALEQILEESPELLEPVIEFSSIKKLQEPIQKLMSLAFPPVLQENEMICAAIPSSFAPVFTTPLFRQTFFDKNGKFIAKENNENKDADKAWLIRAYLFILNKYFNIKCNCNYPVIYKISDSETGLEQYYKMECDFRFVDVHTSGPLPRYSESELAEIQENFIEPEILKKYIKPEDFELRGFTIVRPVDVTQSEILLAIEHDLTDNESVLSSKGFMRLQQRLRTFFRVPNLVSNLAAIHKDRVFLLNSCSNIKHQCIFADSKHISITEFKGTPYEKALKLGKILRISNIKDEKGHIHTETCLFPNETRSVIIAPLEYEGKPIGILDIGTSGPGELCPIDELLMTRIQPLFAIAIQRSLEELDNRIDNIIKEKFTSIHPVVEWKFHQSVLNHMEKSLKNESSDFDPIIFRNVFPIYGGTDIRGSTNQRNHATQKDLSEHLDLANNVISAARKIKDLPIFGELSDRIKNQLNRISKGLETGDEASIIKFLLTEIESIFDHLKTFGKDVISAINDYESAIDINVKTVYKLRRSFEESVYKLNERLAAYIDREDEQAQSLFPHYFERHRTDGVDYLIYLGESLLENKGYNNIYLKNFRLWQIKVACGLAWHTQDLKSSLNVPLDTAHLILVQNSPLSLRFRFDEKRFGVDGAYDIQHEIIKSRIDKAVVSGKNERLTQPGKVAAVYTHPEEAREIMLHMEYLRSESFLTDEIESLDLDPLPGVHGLKALRAGINLESKKLAQRVEKVMG